MTATCPTRPYGWGAVPDAHVRLDDRLGWQTLELNRVEITPTGAACAWCAYPARSAR